MGFVTAFLLLLLLAAMPSSASVGRTTRRKAGFQQFKIREVFCITVFESSKITQSLR
jgi:hypothetical protein